MGDAVKLQEDLGFEVITAIICFREYDLDCGLNFAVLFERGSRRIRPSRPTTSAAAATY